MRRNRDFIGPAGMGGTVALWGASSLIKSIQYGTVTATGSLTGTATITAVVLANSVVMYLGNRTTDTSAALGRIQSRLDLTNTTTVTCTSRDAVATKTVSFAVLEFAPGMVKSLQTGTVNITTGELSKNATITAVNTNKAFLVWNNQDSNTASQNDQAFSTLILLNTTTVTVQGGAVQSGGNVTTAYTVLEFF